MNERIETRVLGLLALALGIFGIFGPYKWHDMPIWITNSALVLALFMALWAILIWVPAPSKGLKKSVAAFLISAGACALIIGLVSWLDPLLLEDKKSVPAFPYVEAGTTAESPLRPRWGILLIKGAPSLTNVEVQVFPLGGGMARRFFYPVVYGRGEPLMWTEQNGQPKIIEFGEGEHTIQLADLNGTYFEIIRVRIEDGRLKRSVDVMKEDKTQPSGLVRLLYENDP